MVEAKAKEKADMDRIADKASYKPEFESRARKNANVVNRAVLEAADKISLSA